MRTHLVAALGLLAVACSGQPQQPPVRSVASPTASPTPYRASPSAATQSPYVPPSTASSGGSVARTTGGSSIRWHESIAAAQSEARAQGKLILVGSTKPDCGLCDKFAHTTAPQCWDRLSQVAVPYMYDITHPESPSVDRTLRANLRGASLMPLVGFLTPDLNWVHGFWGPRSVTEFMGDIESARRIYPVHAAALAAPAPIRGAPTAMLNEYGEREWSAPADWPEPEDALGPVASVSAPVTEPAVAVAPEPPPAPEPAPAAVPAAVEPVAVAAPKPAPAPSAPASDGWSAAATPMSAGIAASPAPFVPEPAPAVIVPSPSPAVAPSSMSESEAQATLEQAYTLIRAGQLDEARAALRRVSNALPNTAAGREAAKGAVAVYNARRVAAADANQCAALKERAARDLAGSRWAALFQDNPGC